MTLGYNNVSVGPNFGKECRYNVDTLPEELQVLHDY